MRALIKRLQEKLERTMSAVAYAEEREVETARQLLSPPAPKDELVEAKAPVAQPQPVRPMRLVRPERV